MGFEYSCFISFRHGAQKLAKEIVEQLYESLSSEIELYIDKQVFVDWKRLSGGDFYDAALANALCKSACMVVVYTPNYFDEKHTFCTREYKAMEKLESLRLKALSSKKQHHGLIIPVVFRGMNYLPSSIRDKRHCYNFENFLLGTSRISRNPKFNEQIRKLAEYIYERCNDMSLLEETFASCDSFSLPTERDVSEWLETFQGPAKKFPITD